VLVSLTSPRFRDGHILNFTTGLNVVLGDDAASNSIGKSSALMVLDFVFGGMDLLERTPKVLQHLRHHHYDFVFAFGEGVYRYRRTTDRPDFIFECNDKHEPVTEIAVKDYLEILRNAYNLPDDEDLSFRGCVGAFCRVWGKDNLNVKKPLAVVQKESEANALNRLAKLFGRFSILRSLEESLKETTEKKKALQGAMRQEFVPKITKTTRKKNESEIGEIDGELDELRSTLATFAINVREVANRETIDLTDAKDALLRERLHVSARLAQIENDVSGTHAPSPAKFEPLMQLFPSVDGKRLQQVQGFHTGIAGILRKELISERRKTRNRLESIDEDVAELNAKLAVILTDVVAPSNIIERVIRLASKRSQLQFENSSYDDAGRLGQEVKDSKDALRSVSDAEFKSITSQINKALRQLVNELSGPTRESPTFHADSRRHTLEHDADDGTGTAYAALLLFDLAILELTPVPFVIEDSLLFKNIENALVAGLLARYDAQKKQVFIAIDEPSKFGTETSCLLSSNAVVELSKKSLLYDTDWRDDAAN
jgi:hypothetical protein